MSDRIPLTRLTSDQLDRLYDERERLEIANRALNTAAVEALERAELAEAEVKRLHAGEEDGYDSRCLPTPGQWIKNYNDATAKSRHAIVTRLTSAAEQGHACAMGFHEERIQEGREAVAAVARVRAACDSVKAAGHGHTPTTPYDKGVAKSVDWVTMRVLEAIDARLVQPEPAPVAAQATDGPACRYCGADCSNGRSWDGGNLYACGPCANDRAAVNRAGGDFDALMRRVRDRHVAEERGEPAEPPLLLPHDMATTLHRTLGQLLGDQDAQAIARLRALHMEEYGSCAECTHESGVPFPCPTIRALDQHQEQP